MAFTFGDESDLKSEPNVVPLCDVLLVLLIIFMVLTPLIQRGVDVQLPTALNTIDMPENPEVILYIKKDGTMYVNQDQAEMGTLQTLLEDVLLAANDRKLYLRADQDLEYGVIVDVIEIIKAAGIEIVGIIVDRMTGETSSIH